MDTPELVTLPCGCFINPVIEGGVKTLKVSPCKVGCVNLRNLLGLADEENKPVEFR